MKTNEIKCCTPNGQIKRYKDCIGCDRNPLELNQNKMTEKTNKATLTTSIGTGGHNNKPLNQFEITTVTLSAVEWLQEQYNQCPKYEERIYEQDWEKAKEMEKEQRGYTESDMRSYASYILNNPVIEPSQWYKIYRTKSK